MDILLLLSLAINLVLLLYVRHISISPSFGIAVQQVGVLMVMTAIGPRICVYGDMDKLGKINDALKTEKKSGMRRWNEIMTKVQEKIRADEKFLIYGGDEFGWLLKLTKASWRRRSISSDNWEVMAIAFCNRVQQLLREFPYEDHEKVALQSALGHPYATITLAYCYSESRSTHRIAMHAAESLVMMAKPKDGSNGKRGQILKVV